MRDGVSHKQQLAGLYARAHDEGAAPHLVNPLAKQMRKLVCDELMDGMVDAGRRGAPNDNHSKVHAQVRALLPHVENAMKLALYTDEKTFSPTKDYSLFALETSSPQSGQEFADRLGHARTIFDGMLRHHHVSVDLRDKLCQPAANGVTLFDTLAAQAVKTVASKSMHEELRADAARTTVHMADVSRQWQSIVGQETTKGASRR